MLNKLNDRNLNLIILSILVVLILLLPGLFRYLSGNPTIAGSDFYDDLRISQDLSNKVYWDSLQDRPHQVLLSHYLLSGFFSYFGQNHLYFLMIIIGVFSVILFYLILDDFFPREYVPLIASCLLVLSPIFLFLFTRLNYLSLGVFLTLLFIYFLKKDNFLSVLFIGLSAVSHPGFLIVNLIILLVYYLYKNVNLVLVFNILSGFFSYFIYVLLHPNFVFPRIFYSPDFATYFTSLGARIGIAFFYLFLGIVGLFLLWKRRSVYIKFALSFTLFFAFSLFSPVGRVILNLYLCLVAAFLIQYLIKRKWAIDTIKKFSLLLIFCSVLFTTALFQDQMIHSEPKSDLIYALSILENKPFGAVFTHQQYSEYVHYFANKPVLIDDFSPLYENYLDKLNDEKRLFYSRDLETTLGLVEKNDISYFLITPEMVNGLVWKRSDDGLMFLLTESQSFDRFFQKNGIMLYEINTR